MQELKKQMKVPLTPNGRTRVIVVLISILATASLAWGGWVMGKVNKVDEHETRIAVLEKAVMRIDDNLEWMRRNWASKKE